MYIFLDNTAPEELAIYVSDDGGKFREYRKSSEGAGSLQKALEEIFVVEKKKLQDLAGLAVRVGTGRFTATRVAAVFTNTVAYALGIPASAVHGADPAEAFANLLRAPKNKYISAEYSAEPRLGTNK